MEYGERERENKAKMRKVKGGLMVLGESGWPWEISTRKTAKERAKKQKRILDCCELGKRSEMGLILMEGLEFSDLQWFLC